MTAGDPPPARELDAPIGPPMLGALLRISYETMRGRVIAELHARGYTDLTEAHNAVLRWPGPDGLRPVELAERLSISRQALNYLLGQLEDNGYLRRVEDPGDQRSKRIRLTERGHAVFAAIREVIAGIEAEWAEVLGAEDLERLRGLLQRLVIGLDPADAQVASRE